MFSQIRENLYTRKSLSLQYFIHKTYVRNAMPS